MPRKKADTPKEKSKRPAKSARSPKNKTGEIRTGQDYDKKRELGRAISAAVTAAGQELSNTIYAEAIEAGPKNPDRRAEALGDLLFFQKTYGGEAFKLPFAPYHYAAKERIEEALKTGSSFAFTFPRGGGKSTFCHWAIIWASLNDRANYSLYIGATSASASTRLDNIKKTFRFNDLLFEDFPEVCGPIRHLQGEPRKATGQKWKGVTTGIEWSSKIVLPTVKVPYGIASGNVIDTASIDGEIRGRLFVTQSGETVRPTFVVADDPQTRESAKSLPQCDYREQIIKGDVKYLAGPGQRTAVIIPCTVIYEGDLADRLIDRKRNPEFRGVRARMMESYPERLDLWEQYQEIRNQDLRDGGLGNKATDFYRANFDEMNRGAQVTWPERFNEDEISAIENAMRLKLEDEISFMAECQSEPITRGGEDSERELTVSDILDRELPIQWGTVPDETEEITGFIDVSEKVLWWALVAWRKDGTGSIFKYGVYPDQGLSYVSLQGVRRTLKHLSPGNSTRVAVLEGLEALTESLLGSEYAGEDGEPHSISALAIDSGDGDFASEIYKFCRRSKYRTILRPSKGVGVSATRGLLVDPAKKRKAKQSVVGQWLFSRTPAGVFLLQYDANLWKTIVSEALKIHKQNSGAVTLTKPIRGANHRMIAEQLTAEKPKRVETAQRRFTQWVLIPGRDNHLFDCVVGAAVVASTRGITFELGHKVKSKSKSASDNDSKSSDTPTPKKQKRTRSQSQVSF